VGGHGKEGNFTSIHFSMNPFQLSDPTLLVALRACIAFYVKKRILTLFSPLFFGFLTFRLSDILLHFCPICDINFYKPIPNSHSLSYSSPQSIPVIGSEHLQVLFPAPSPRTPSSMSYSLSIKSVDLNRQVVEE
jgi:hypothetical protein